MIDTGVRGSSPTDRSLGLPLPSRVAPRGGASLQALFDTMGMATSTVRGGLGRTLAAAYDGDLAIPVRTDRPTVIANFVETVDGVVALDASGESGGGEVSGFNPADRLVMALLRSLADAVLVGGGTARASGGGAWTGRRLRPDLDPEIADLRRRLGLQPQPTTIVVTASGRLVPSHRGFRDPEVPVVIAGPDAAVERLEPLGWPSHVRLERFPAGATLAGSILEIAGRAGVRVLLSEAGPHITAVLLEAAVIDELFLTVSPQVAGRAHGVDRLSLVEGAALWPDDPRWLRLQSVRRGGDHLFLRYRFEEARS